VTPRRRVVVTGLGIVSPLGNDVNHFWQALCAGRSGISRLPPPMAALPAAIGAQAIVRGANPDDTPAIAYARAAARAAARTACIGPRTLDSRRLGIAIGANFRGPDLPAIARLVRRLPADGGADLARALEDIAAQPSDARVLPDVLAHLPACRVASDLRARGPWASPVGACAAGTIAVIRGVRCIEDGRADVVVAGGSGANLDPLTFTGYQALGILASATLPPEQASRPFDRRSSGQVLGDGAAMLVLESRDHALRRGVRALAEVAGWGCSTEARPFSTPDPRGDGAARAMRRALDHAALSPCGVDWVCANAVSRPEVDGAELAALEAVFGGRPTPVPVSAPKSMLGNTVAASGPLQLVAAALALRDQLIPPTANLDEPPPTTAVDFAAPRARAQRVRTVMSNTFAFGGQNAVVILRATDAERAA